MFEWNLPEGRGGGAVSEMYMQKQNTKQTTAEKHHEPASNQLTWQCVRHLCHLSKIYVLHEGIFLTLGKINLTCHMFDTVDDLIVGRRGDRAERLLQVLGAEVHQRPLPAPHCRRFRRLGFRRLPEGLR